MKRIVTGDWQLADNARDRYRLDWVENQFKPLVTKHQPDEIIFLGDLTEAKDNHPARLVNNIVEIFNSIGGDGMGNGPRVYFLQGNHDYEDINHPFWRFLALECGWIDYIEQPEVLDNCLFLPHTRDHKRDWKDVNFKEDYDFIFAHNIFTGATGNGQQLSGIPTDVFRDDSCVISGDVHEPQSFDVVTYAGAPFLCDFGDSYTPRVLLLDGRDIKSIKTKGPQKRLVEGYKDGKGVVLGPVPNPGDIVKVRFRLTPEQTTEWNQIRSDLIEWAAGQKLIFHSAVPVVEFERGSHPAITVTSKTDGQYLDEFVKRNGVDKPTTEIGREMIK